MNFAFRLKNVTLESEALPVEVVLEDIEIEFRNMNIREMKNALIPALREIRAAGNETIRRLEEEAEKEREYHQEMFDAKWKAIEEELKPLNLLSEDAAFASNGITE